MSNPNFQGTFGGDGFSAGFSSGYGTSTSTVKLICPTKEFRDWVANNFNLKDLKLTLNARNSPGALTDLTYPLNDPQKEKLELYKFVYPSSGLMKWGECLVLINGNDLPTMQNVQQGTLTLQSSPANILKFQNMFLIATIPICEVGVNQASGRIGPSLPNDAHTLHLGLMVDERFFIANYSRSYYSDLSCDGSWSEVISSLLDTAFNTTMYPNTYTIPTIPSINSAYGNPSLFSDLIEQGEYSSGQLLESVLLNCGLILVRHINGNYTLQTYNTANQIEDRTNYKSTKDGGDNTTNGETNSSATSLSGYCMRAGGEWTRWGRNNWTGALPAQCVFHFPYWDTTYSTCVPLWAADDSGTSDADPCDCATDTEDCAVYPPSHAPDDVFRGSWYNQWDGDGEYHLRSPLNAISYYTIKITKSTAFANNGLPMPLGASYGQKLFRETARAMGSPPTNMSQLVALAKQLAGDFYNRKYWSLIHETWDILVPPSGSGWLTYVYEYHDLDCSTRILGDYLNRDVEQMMHDFCPSSSSSESSSSHSSSESSSSESESSESESSENESSENESSSESEGQSSGSECYDLFNDLPYISNPVAVLGVDDNGCWGLVPIVHCDSSSSSSMGG